MKTKVKKFSHKLLALFMAVLMAATCFTGVITAYGGDVVSADKQYSDDYIEYNTLGWAVLSDEQVATALLDYADVMLEEYGPKIDALLSNLPSSIQPYLKWNAATRVLKVDAYGIVTYDINVHLHSVNEVFETIQSVDGLIRKFNNFLGSNRIGDAGNIQLGSVANNDSDWHVTREEYSSTEIIQRVIAVLQINSGDYNGKDVLGEFFRGSFDLGLLDSFVDVYSIIGDALGISDSSYKSNLVYNIAKNLIFEYTDWYTADEIAAFNNGSKTWVYDDELLEKLTTELLDKISVLVTYDQAYDEEVTGEDGTVTTKTDYDTSASRYLEIKDEMTAKKVNYATAAANLGYDPNLVYSDEFLDDDGNPQNVLLFAYGAPDENGFATSSTTKITLTASDSLFKFGYTALDMAWDTVLKGTVKLIHVNNDYDEGHGANFDNNYYYYFDKTDSWNDDDIASNYTAAKVTEWANAVYKDYGCKTADEFLANVKSQLTFDRTASDTSEGKWSDIDETKLFFKLRYSPLADYYFNMETGPINLYFAQTGTPALDEFFDTKYKDYSSMVAGLNDALVAAVKDLFPSSSNIIGTRPTMQETGNMTTVNDTAVKKITSTLTSNALKMVQYVADATDANILKAFYTTYGSSATLSETNLEEAMIPLLIACIGQINLGTGKLESIIHPADWDMCKDAEAVAYLCLREYLQFILPDKDYSVLVKTTSGYIEATLEGTIMPMARDALAYVVEAYVPITKSDGTAWHTETESVQSSETIITLANSVLCYYAGDFNLKKSQNSNEKTMAIGALLGLCNGTTGEGTISTQNTLWQNIDAIVNRLLPVIGTLQGTGYGKASSQTLIWDDIVNGALEISATRTSGFQGVSNFLYKLLTIVSAEPIQKTSIVMTIYDVLKDLINALFGARYDAQIFKTIVPDATSSHPFDDFFQVSSLAGTGGGASQVGALQKLICNFVEFFGYGTDGVGTYPDTMLPAISFALTAVNSFLPDAITTIGDHQFKLPTAKFTNETIQNATEGDLETSVKITNNAVGINNTVLDDKGNAIQLSRYYLRVDGAKATNDTTKATTTLNDYIPSDYIAPTKSEEMYVPVTFSTAGGATQNTIEVEITYSIVTLDEGGDLDEELYTGLTTSAYCLITSDQGWYDTVYDATNLHYNSAFDSINNADKDVKVGQYTVSSADKFASDLVVTYPWQIVVGTSNLSQMSDVSFRIYNSHAYGTSGGTTTFDGFYTYETGTVTTNNLSTAVTPAAVKAGTADMSTTSVTVNANNAIPIFNKTTGDLINYDKFDYRIETSKGSGEYGEWQRNGASGYTAQEVSENTSKDKEAGLDVETRTHIAYTLEEALAQNIIAAYTINSDGVYTSMYLKNNGKVAYSSLLSQMSFAVSGLDAFYIGLGSTGVDYTTSVYVNPFKLSSDTSSIKSGEYPIKGCFYSSSGSATFATTVYIAENSAASDLDNAFDELKDTLASYRQTDFTDYADGASATYASAKSILFDTLSEKSAPLSTTNALLISDETTTIAETSTTTSTRGDQAYIPYTTSAETVTFTRQGKSVSYTIPESVKADATVGKDGIYYYDEECTIPIYSPKPVTSSDVSVASDGTITYKNYASLGVTLELHAGDYYIANEKSYVKEWDTTTYKAPYQIDSSVQATDDNDNPLYTQVQFVYANAAGSKVNSTNDWACKHASTTSTIKPNSGKTEYRGSVTRAKDTVEYTLDIVNDKIKQLAEDLYKNISVARTGLDENNFHIATYNKMVDYAKLVEKQYSINVSYTDAESGKVVNRKNMEYTDANALMQSLKKANTDYTYSLNSKISSVMQGEYLRMFGIMAGNTIERGYQGTVLEAEILCASGNDYNGLTGVPATYDEDGNVKTAASVRRSSTSKTPKYGAFSGSTLSNVGSTVYSTASWNAYIDALANALALAALGNGGYTHKQAAKFDIESLNTYTDQLTDVHDAFVALKKAEIGLTVKESGQVTLSAVDHASFNVKIEDTGDTYSNTSVIPVEVGQTITIDATVDAGYQVSALVINGDRRVVTLPYSYKITEADTTIVPEVEKEAGDGITISGTVLIATNVDGTEYTKGISGIDIKLADGTVVGTSGDNGVFSVTVPAGTTSLTLHRDNVTIDRTVTISGDANVSDANIPVVICDYNGDKEVNSTDKTVFSLAYGNKEQYNLYCDYNGDGEVNSTDKGVFSAFYGKSVVYADLAF